MPFTTTSLHPIKETTTTLSDVLKLLSQRAKSAQPLELQRILEQTWVSVHTHESVLKILRTTSFPGRPNDSDNPKWVYDGYKKALGSLLKTIENPPANSCTDRVLFSNSLSWYLKELLKLVQSGSIIIVKADTLKSALLLTDMSGLLASK
ncbi:hypothetical protein RhiJN_00509 [Ceratobasidium sp. AG-Ba]|nr:hypothetical protein RhiJN_00509 [Ceratobasidium sp. AG-Ba]QRW01540.1 hypothetical protein RhiLY_00537 [Ceratobasidium sp. AG-Ba]